MQEITSICFGAYSDVHDELLIAFKNKKHQFMFAGVYDLLYYVRSQTVDLKIR